MVRVLTKSYKADISDVLKVSLLLELKTVDSIYFYFILFLFLYFELRIRC